MKTNEEMRNDFISKIDKFCAPIIGEQGVCAIDGVDSTYETILFKFEIESDDAANVRYQNAIVRSLANEIENRALVNAPKGAHRYDEKKAVYFRHPELVKFGVEDGKYAGEARVYIPSGEAK